MTHKKYKITSVIPLLTMSAVMIVFSTGIIRSSVQAETVNELQAQAAGLQAQIDANNARASELAKEADSLKRKIAEFDLQISTVNAQIELTSVKIAELQDNLVKAQAELDRQKELLKTTLRALYKKGDASSFELLVGSQSFTEFVNQQEYLSRLKTGIQKSTEAVIALKQQIKAQEEEQKTLLEQQQQQKTALDTARAERQQLLDTTQGQEASYRAQADSLKAQQLEINRKIFEQSNAQIFAGDPNKGGYPAYLANAGHDSILDPWGMFNRECVSYTAWRVHQRFVLGQSGRDMPSNWPSYWGMYGGGHGGNARDWLGDASVDGIPYDKNPHPGDIAILRSGVYGHAAYVEQVYGDGRIYISQYNWDWNGNYSEAIIDYTQADWFFIHF